MLDKRNNQLTWRDRSLASSPDWGCQLRALRAVPPRVYDSAHAWVIQCATTSASVLLPKAEAQTYALCPPMMWCWCCSSAVDIVLMRVDGC